MTYDHRHDDPAGHDDHETRVVERDRYVDREPPAERDRYAAAPPPAGSQVNVNSGSRRYAASSSQGALYYARRVLSLLFGILAVLLAIRIVLLALAANQTNPIVEFVYGITEPFVAPFRGMFQFDQVTPGGGSVLDIAAVIAFIGWLLIYLLLMAILSLADRDRV